MSITHVSPEELREFMRSRHEKDYLLLDVRQPEEYRRGHIPGARLLPLSELMQSAERLPRDKTLIFYCHSGGRSMAAAVVAEEELAGRPALINLNGGMMAWNGARLTDLPQVRLFEGLAPARVFETAIDLEKGAQLFYEAAAAANAGEEIFARLMRAERAHAETLYGFWEKEAGELEPFDVLYERQQGEILEGGVPLKSALQTLARAAGDGLLRWIETALQIEFAAYDLYRVVADRQEDEAAAQAFLSLAQAEKAHMQALAAALPRY